MKMGEKALIILNHSLLLLFFPLPVQIVKAKFNHACLWPEHQTAALKLFVPGISIKPDFQHK